MRGGKQRETVSQHASPQISGHCALHCVMVAFGDALCQLPEGALEAGRPPVSLFLWSALGSAFDAPVQARILEAAREAPNLAATLISTAFNIGIALGA